MPHLSGARFLPAGSHEQLAFAHFHRLAADAGGRQPAARDVEFETDSYFSDKGNRAKLENMLNRGMASKASRQAILNGTPMIRVEVHPDFINVEVYRD